MSGLEAGSYDLSIRAPTLIDEMEFSEKRLPFNINEGPNQEKSFLTCDEDLLIEMADISGGGFFREGVNFMNLKKFSVRLAREESSSTSLTLSKVLVIE